MTWCSFGTSFKYVCFNPHTHEGCDTDFVVAFLFTQSFNPHTHEGCDLSSAAITSVPSMFQSTHPRRVWLKESIKGIFWIVVSIHTPTKGVTPWTVAACANVCCFNPHTHEGCDRLINVLLRFLQSFNPHTHEGCDLFNVTYFVVQTVSIHTPTKGVTLSFLI